MEVVKSKILHRRKPSKSTISGHKHEVFVGYNFLGRRKISNFSGSKNIVFASPEHKMFEGSKIKNIENDFIFYLTKIRDSNASIFNSSATAKIFYFYG